MFLSWGFLIVFFWVFIVIPSLLGEACLPAGRFALSFALVN